MHVVNAASCEPDDTFGRSAFHAEASAPMGSGSIHLLTAPLGSRRKATLGAQTWTATLYELAPGDATGAYHYDWCREEWALVVSGAPTLRHADGQTGRRAGRD